MCMVLRKVASSGQESGEQGGEGSPQPPELGPMYTYNQAREMSDMVTALTHVVSGQRQNFNESSYYTAPSMVRFGGGGSGGGSWIYRSDSPSSSAYSSSSSGSLTGSKRGREEDASVMQSLQQPQFHLANYRGGFGDSRTAESSVPALPASSSSSHQDWNYHVFMNFRGKDTRNTFTGHLVAALKQTGLRIFIDEDELPKGEEISLQLRKSIQESRICIVVFSKNYASSRWCLDELVEILRCNKLTGNIVYPIFYDVDPTEVRYQKGSFADIFTTHEKRYARHKIETWRSALSEAADLSGFCLKTDANGNEASLVEKIVGSVLIKSEPINLNILHENQVGLHSRIEEIVSLLNLESNDARMLGIYGLGGIGKTTIAEVVFKKLLHKFDGSYFAENVKDVVKKDGLVSLQQNILSEITKRNVTFGNSSKGKTLMEERFRSKRVLIVLDDVKDLKQIKLLAGQRHMLGPGSRVIITTRDVQLLNQARVDTKYEVEKLNQNESMELFCWHAFNKPTPTDDLKWLSEEAVRYCDGLPLALEVIGAYFVDKSSIEWKSGIEKLIQVPNNEIQEKLKVSFDALEDDEVKAVFLDLACLFVGETKEYVITLWNACGYFAEDAICNLTRKCLLKIDSCNKLTMHDHLRNMGREIVRKESPNKPQNRSRLWHLKDVVDVLKNKKGGEAIEAIKLQLPNSERMKFRTSTFKKMSTLRFLQIDNVDLSGSSKNIFKELKWLRWRRMKKFPDDLKPEKLVVIDLLYGQFITLWRDVKRLENLTILDLGNCKCLKETPNFSGVTSLKKLYLNDCTSLLKIHPSIGILVRLRILYLSYSEMIPNLPDSVCDLESLEQLGLRGCSNLENLPEQIGSLKCLKFLDVAETPIKHLPESTKLLSNLAFLNMECCNITSLPQSVCDLESLKALSINYCPKLQFLPGQLRRMRGLRIAIEGIDIKNILQGSELLCWVENCATSYIRFMDVNLQGRLILLSTPGSDYVRHYHHRVQWSRAEYIRCIDHYFSTLKPKN